MSKHSGVRFQETSFWVYDVVGGVFLWHIINVAEQYLLNAHIPWLEERIKAWRVTAVINDLADFADDDWDNEQIRLITKLGNCAISNIRQHGDFTDEEISSWAVLDDLRIFPRGYEIIPVKFIINFGEAFLDMLNGELPEAPKGYWWFYGVGDEYSPSTIKMA